MSETKTAWWFHPKPAAHPPTCRRPGCLKPAVEDGEWCADDQAALDIIRERALAEIERWNAAERSMRQSRNRRKKAR